MRKKTLLPITLMCLLALVACGGRQSSSSVQSSSPASQSSVSSQAPASSSNVASSTVAPVSSNSSAQSENSASETQQPVSSDVSSIASEEPSSQAISSSEQGPVSSEEPSSQVISSEVSSEISEQPSSQGTSEVPSSSETPSESSSEAPSSEDPTVYGVVINNKAEFADWHAGDANITLDIALTPEANVRLALMNEELVITSSDPAKVSVAGLVLTANEPGNVTITASYHGKTDSVDVEVKAEDVKTISDIIANGKKNDVITFKGYYLGHSTRINYLGSETYPYVYVGDGTRSIIVYCMAASLLNGIEVGDIVKVTGTYSPYNGLPETASGSVTKFSKSSGEGLVRPPVININADNPTVALGADNIGSPVHVQGATVTKIVKTEAKSRTDLAPAVDGQPVTTNYYERTFKIKVGETEYTLFSNERYDGEMDAITELSVGDTISFDAFVNIKENAYNLAMISNASRVASIKDPVQSLEISAERTKLYAGATLTVNAAILPETALQMIEWSTSNKDVATVADGIVTGVAAGNVTITAKTLGTPVQTKTIDLQVIAKPTAAQHAGTEADPYTVDDVCVVTEAIENKKYSANPVYVEGKVYSSEWSSEYSNYTIWLEDAVGGKAFELYRAVLSADILANEALTALYTSTSPDAAGNNIGYLVGHTVRASGYLQHYNTTLEMAPNNGVTPTIFYVSPSELAGLSVKESTSIAVGADETLQLVASPVDASLEGVVWSSNNEAVATVDQNGKVTGVGAGEAVIKAQLNEEIKAECTVTVIAGGIAATSVTLSESAATLSVVDKLTLTAEVLPADTTDTLVWSSSDETVATVANGVVTPLKPGSVTITAQAGEVKAERALTITQPSLADFNNAKKGDAVDFYAYYVGRYNANVSGYFVADGNVGAYIYAKASAVTGLTDNAILHVKGTVDVYNGLREIIPTSVEVVASHEGLTAPAKLAITAENRNSLTVSDQGRLATVTGKITAISVTPEYGKQSPMYTIEIAEGVSIQAQLHKSNLTQDEYNDFANKAKQGVTVTIDAYVAAYKSKNTDLTQLTAADFQLVNPKVTSAETVAATAIALDQASLELEAGNNATLVATLTPANATDTVVWSSSDETVATVDQTGKVTAVAAGTATITVTAGGFSATCTVTVTGEATPATDATYSLVNLNGSNTNYASTYDVTFEDAKIWNIPGNQGLNDCLKIGGKLTAATDRALYSKSAYDSVASIAVKHGAADSQITVNSLTLYVFNSAADAAEGDPTKAAETVVGAYADNTTVTFQPAAEGTKWEGKYFRIVYNMSSSASSKNYGVRLLELKVVF